MKRKNIYFFIACFVAILFLAIPLLLRCSCIYDLVWEYLSVFRNTEYKGIYIETIGALFGAFLGVTGAVWAQNLAIKQSKEEEIRTKAQIIHDDLNNSLIGLKEIFQTDNKTLPKTMDELLHKAQNNSQDYMRRILEIRVVVLSDWEQMVLSVGHRLDTVDRRLLLNTYSQLARISALTDQIYSSPNSENTLRSKLFELAGSLSIESEHSKIEQLNSKIKQIAQGKKVVYIDS